MNILIVKTSAIGDVIHTLPSLWSLRAHFPDAQITWLVEESAADLLYGHPALNRVLVARRKTWLNDARAGRLSGAVGGLIQFIRQLRDTRYDLIIDFQGLIKSAIWVALAKGVRKVGFGRGMEHAEHSYLALNERVPAVDMNQHAIDRSLLLLKGIGVPAADLRYAIPVSAAHESEAVALLLTVRRARGRSPGRHQSHGPLADASYGSLLRSPHWPIASSGKAFASCSREARKTRRLWMRYAG